MAKPRLLLTGGTGFVGRQVLPRLSDRYEIFCTSRTVDANGAEHWCAADLRDGRTCERLIADIRPEVLVHLAWNTEHGVFWEAQDNADWLDAGRALFGAFARRGGRRIVATGSCAEYGGDSQLPRREDEEVPANAPLSRYGRAKLALLESLRELPCEHAWARVFLTYGEGEDERRLVPSICRALLRGEPARCTSGRQRRDFIDVRELGQAIAMLAAAKLTGTINLGQGEETTVGDAAKLLGELAGRPELIEIGALPDRPGESARLVPDLTRQQRELGFTPHVTLRQGLSHALAWWSTRG